jgi:hypothetical protein
MVTFRLIFFILTFFSIGVVSNFKSREQPGVTADATRSSDSHQPQRPARPSIDGCAAHRAASGAASA